MLVTRPPMGWNSWNTFGQNINEDLIKKTADIIVDSGLKDAGYEYVVIDDCWSIIDKRDEQGRIIADPEKFPSGMKALADYIHSKGLKFGMYSCDGPLTCAGYPGSFDNEFIDAKTFADWGVDYLKYDNCYHERTELEGKVLYNRMSMALKASGRDILFSACNWGTEDVHTWIRSTGAHIFRSTGDIVDSFGSMRDIAVSQFDKLSYSANGCFNDIDMLIVGMKGKGNVGVEGCTDEEYLMHFAVWSYFQSPLMIGCDIRDMSEATLATLKNAELIKINQDAEGRPPFMVESCDGAYTFLKHLENGEYALAYFNFKDEEFTLGGDFANFGLGEDTGMKFDLVDIMTGEKLKDVAGKLPVTLAPHSFRILRGRVHA